MDTMAIALRLPPSQYDRLVKAAEARRVPVDEMAQTALIEWLERQARLERARLLMRELGRGLDEGPSPHDAARNHDAHLYSRGRA